MLQVKSGNGKNALPLRTKHGMLPAEILNSAIEYCQIHIAMFCGCPVRGEQIGV
jgi:hypothetical protein